MQLRQIEPATTTIDTGFAPVSAPAFGPVGRHNWRGASGATYPHAAYTLLACPAPAAGSYVLVRRNADGTRTPLAAGAMPSLVASLNLAAIRREAARLGANEVHLASFEGDVKRSSIAAFDLGALWLADDRMDAVASLN